MTIPRFDAVGYCAHYSQTGDQAFAYALKLARAEDRQLNVFHFLDDPYRRETPSTIPRRASDLPALVTQRERELRLYYDDLAGDYVEVGFRLCQDESWRELHRCLAGHEFQVLVLARPESNALFCGKPIEVFADAFICPVVLVGPGDSNPYGLNNSAAIQADRLGLEDVRWERIETGRARTA